jgi:putative ABC transport system permease protein
MQHYWLDLRYALRALLHSPTYAAAVICSLTLGIGANVAVFSVFNAILLRPLPYPHQEELVTIYETNPARGILRYTVSPPDFLEWRASGASLRLAAAHRGWTPNLTGVDEAERLNGLRVSGDFFAVLGLEPIAGRLLARDDEAIDNRVVAISQSLWRRVFGGDTSVVGRTLQLDGVPFVVAGIVPPSVQYPNAEVDIWAPLNLAREQDQRGEHSLMVIARLHPGRTLVQARAELRAISTRHEAESAGHLAELSLMRDWFVGPNSRRTLWVLLAAVGLLLVTACANVANLLLARCSTRAHELTIRIAIGATRGRLIRLLVTESLLVSAIAGFAGLLVAMWTVDLLLGVLPPASPYRSAAIALDWRVLAFAGAASIAAGLTFGVLPALRYSKTAAAQGTASRFTPFRMQATLLGAQAGLASALLAVAVMLTQTFLGAWRVDAGFSPSGVMTARMSLPGRQPAGAQAEFYQQVIDRLSADPDITAAAAVTHVPASGDGNSGFITIEGREALSADPATRPTVSRLIATSQYFRALAIDIRRGRAFLETDGANAQPVVIINEAMARRYWGDDDPVGRRIKRGTPTAQFPWLTIVGVAADVRQQGLGAAAVPTVYLHLPQSEEPALTFVVKSNLSEGAAAARIRSAVRDVNRNQPIGAMRSLDSLVFGSISSRWMPTVWMSVFASLALVLASLGVYGVVAYAVERRRREFGIRLALGANRADVIRLAVRQGVTPAVIGTLAGVIGAALLTRLNSSLFPGASMDLTTFAGAAAILGTLALMASYAPARRIAQEDAALTLRAE